MFHFENNFNFIAQSKLTDDRLINMVCEDVRS